VSLEVDVFTLFPGYLDWLRESRPVRNVLESGDLALRAVDMRPFGLGAHRQVDDSPYGGGAGMVIRVDVVDAALQAVYGADTPKMLAERRIAVLAASGRRLDDALAAELAGLESLTLVCGRYEGVDERVAEHLVDEELSIGNYVLSGGELAAAIVVDAIGRLLPGVLNDETSALFDSFQDNLLAPPVYTRPADFRGIKVPDILLSGDPKKIEEWRYDQSLQRTRSRRPGLLNE